MVAFIKKLYMFLDTLYTVFHHKLLPEIWFVSVELLHQNLSETHEEYFDMSDDNLKQALDN